MHDLYLALSNCCKVVKIVRFIHNSKVHMVCLSASLLNSYSLWVLKIVWFLSDPWSPLGRDHNCIYPFPSRWMIGFWYCWRWTGRMHHCKVSHLLFSMPWACIVLAKEKNYNYLHRLTMRVSGWKTQELTAVESLNWWSNQGKELKSYNCPWSSLCKTIINMHDTLDQVWSIRLRSE